MFQNYSMPALSKRALTAKVNASSARCKPAQAIFLEHGRGKTIVRVPYAHHTGLGAAQKPAI